MRPKTEKIIIRNEPDAEHILKVLEKNPKLYEKLSEKLLEKMNEEFDEQLEANVNDSEKLGK
jgi:uroporphyrinogen-III decarboxylase